MPAGARVLRVNCTLERIQRDRVSLVACQDTPAIRLCRERAGDDGRLGIAECLTLDLVEIGALRLDKAEVETEGAEDGAGGQEDGAVGGDGALDELVERLLELDSYGCGGRGGGRGVGAQERSDGD